MDLSQEEINFATYFTVSKLISPNLNNFLNINIYVASMHYHSHSFKT